MKEVIQTTRFDNGLTVITDRMPDVRSVTLGFMFRTGARHEPLELNGISHFIEHTVFKGTTRMSAREIAVETDRLGGNLDAFTMHEETGFAIKVVDSETPRAFALLAAILADPRFDEADLKREQRVIIEEIRMTDDAPEDYLGELFHEKLFGGHPLGLPIAGTPKTVRSFDAAKTRAYHADAFAPQNLVIAAAGNLEHERIVELAAKSFGHGGIADRRSHIADPAVFAPILVKKNKNLEQAQLIISTPFTSAVDERRYAADVLTNTLGGGTSSRLWQKVREEKGLAYSVGASAAMYQDCGVFTIYAGCSPAKAGSVLDIALREVRDLVRRGITPEELDLMKAQSVAAILLGLEDSGARASTLARLEMVHGRQIPIDETIARIEAVTIDEVQSVAREFFTTENVGFGALGDFNGFKVTRERLEI